MSKMFKFMFAQAPQTLHTGDAISHEVASLAVLAQAMAFVWHQAMAEVGVANQTYLTPLKRWRLLTPMGNISLTTHSAITAREMVT
jgi:hypothetical protein